MAEYTIKDLEKLSGILAHTIRIWEKRYNIFTPARTSTNRRKYSDDDLRSIINISILNRNGLKISKIALLTQGEIEEKVDYLSKNVYQTNTQIESLMVAMIELNERYFTDILSRSILSRGFEDTFDNIVFPFLSRTGSLWSTGSINPAQEHFVSNIIRQKLIAAIDSQSSEISENSKKVLLFLPENELHEIGLIYFKYLAVKRGHETLYLGQLTPFDSVVYSVDLWEPDIIVTGILSSFSNIDRHEFIEKLADRFRSKTIVLGGLLASESLRGHITGVFQVNESKDFVDILNS